MGSYSNRGHMIHEAASGASVSHFSWFYPGGLFAAPKTTSSSPPQGTRFNPEPILPATPIRSVGPKTETSKSKKKGSTPANAGKQKPSNQVPSKSLKVKQPKKSPSKKIKGKSIPDAKREKNLNIDIDKANFDLSGMPSPFCSCTGVPRVCYRWGAGGWQSSCCTINVSEYPLPMSPKRPGARMAGRKMSNGAYIKLLWKLAAEGHDLSHPVDLKEHWARHGTNKFVTIK